MGYSRQVSLEPSSYNNNTAAADTGADPFAFLQKVFGEDTQGAQMALLQLQMLSMMQLVMLLRALEPELLRMLAGALGVNGSNGASRSDDGGVSRSERADPKTSTSNNAKYDPASDTGSVTDTLFKAVIVQESGGKYGAVNHSSGALGIGQVMPANVASWSKEALGYSITPQQFLNSPQLQDKIIKHKLDQYYQEARKKGFGHEDAVRYVAAKWYSGRGENMNSNKPQNGYPSIRAYTMSVLSHYQRAQNA